MARKFGSNSSLANSNNSNSRSVPLRRSASLRIKKSPFNVQAKEIESADFKRAPKPEPIQLPKSENSIPVRNAVENQESQTSPTARVLIGKHRKGGFLSRGAPPKVAVPEVGQNSPSPRKSMKLQQLEARYGEKIGVKSASWNLNKYRFQSPLPNKVILPSTTSKTASTAETNLPQPQSQAATVTPQTPVSEKPAVKLRTTSRKERTDEKVSLLSGATGTIVLATCYLTFLCANYLNSLNSI